MSKNDCAKCQDGVRPVLSPRHVSGERWRPRQCTDGSQQRQRKVDRMARGVRGGGARPGCSYCCSCRGELYPRLPRCQDGVRMCHAIKPIKMPTPGRNAYDQETHVRAQNDEMICDMRVVLQDSELLIERTSCRWLDCDLMYRSVMGPSTPLSGLNIPASHDPVPSPPSLITMYSLKA